LEEFLCRIPRVGDDILPNMSETDLQLLARYSRHRSAAATSTQAIAMTTLQKTVVTAIVTVLAGTGIYQARQASQLREENRTLQQQHAPLVERVESLISERDQTAQQLSALRDENERLYRNTGELLRLRGEIGVLRRQLDDHQIQAESRRSDNRETTGDAGFTLTPGALHDMGNSTPEAAIQTFLSAAMQSNRGMGCRIAGRRLSAERSVGEDSSGGA
jgi:hypothetical protein